MTNFAGKLSGEMARNSDPVFSRNVVEFVAVANEFCKYAEHASEIKGDEMLKILQRILPLLYLKASLLPALEPFFEDGNEKFVTETDWNMVNDSFQKRFGTADEYTDFPGKDSADTETPVTSSLAENLADMYQDMKDFLLLYQTGTKEVMNDAVWECRMNFENIWGQKLVNSLRAIHRFLYSGDEISEVSEGSEESGDERDTSEWIISKRQKDYRKNDR
jgi:hypothetical protein